MGMYLSYARHDLNCLQYMLFQLLCQEDAVIFIIQSNANEISSYWEQNMQSIMITVINPMAACLML